MPCRRIAALALTTAATLIAAPAATAAPAGSYKGKIDYQGYEITFKVKGSKITKIRARMLQDCAGDGMSEQFTIAPDTSWTIKGGKFKGTKKETFDSITATYVFEGTISKSGTVKGFIREYDYIDGVGIVCDTLKRTFKAKRG
jgi:hypothetical protein